MPIFVHTGDGPANAPPIDPGATAIYGVAWDPFLPAGATVVGSAWLVDGLNAGDVQESVSVLVNGLTYTTVNTVALSGAMLGESYTITNVATFSDGQIIPRSMIIECVEQ